MQSLLTHLNNRNLDKTAADYGVQYIKKDGTRCEPMEQRAQRPNRRQTESKAKPSLLEYCRGAKEEGERQPTTNREQYQACPKLCRIATEEDKVKEEDLTSYFIAHPFTEWETLQNTKKPRIDIF